MTNLPPVSTDEVNEEMSYGIRVLQLQLSADKSLRYVAMSDMDPKVAQAFAAYIAPCACPTVEGEQAFYVHDWERWNRSHNAAA